MENLEGGGFESYLNYFGVDMPTWITHREIVVEKPRSHYKIAEVNLWTDENCLMREYPDLDVNHMKAIRNHVARKEISPWFFGALATLE